MPFFIPHPTAIVPASGVTSFIPYLIGMGIGSLYVLALILWLKPWRQIVDKKS